MRIKISWLSKEFYKNNYEIAEVDGRYFLPRIGFDEKMAKES